MGEFRGEEYVKEQLRKKYATEDREPDVILEIWLDDAGNIRHDTISFWPMKDEEDAAKWAGRESESDTIYMFASLGPVG